MKITRFDKTICKEVSKTADSALQQLSQAYGLNITYKGGSFSLNNFTMKFEASVVGEGGVVLSKEATNFKSYCQMYNLEPTDLGQTFTSDDGTKYKVTGITSRGGKYPILAENLSNGKIYKLPERMVQRGLGRKITELGKLMNPFNSH